MPDYELGIPASYFEYEIDNRLHYLMCSDQQYIPEDVRIQKVEKNPNCSSEYWRPQVDLEQENEMKYPDWVPNTHNNVYNKKMTIKNQKEYLDQNSNL